MASFYQDLMPELALLSNTYSWTETLSISSYWLFQ